MATRSIDVFIPLHNGASTHVHLQILRGDITSEDTEAIAVFREPNGTPSGDCLRVLEAAGQSVDEEYHRVKAQGGRDVNKGVVQTGVGNLDKPNNILHLHVEHNLGKFRETVSAALRVAEKREVKSIAFPSLPDDFSSFEFIKTIVEVFEQFSIVDRPICLHFIQVVIMQENAGLAQNQSARREKEFEIYKDFVLIQSGLGLYAVSDPLESLPLVADGSSQMLC